MKNRPFRERLGFALAGITDAWRREPSFRMQAAIGLVAIIITIALRPGLLWTAAVVTSIALVMALELVNSAIEAVIDHLHPEHASAIRLAKDMAAGAVLVASAGAVAVGVLMVASVASAAW